MMMQTVTTLALTVAPAVAETVTCDMDGARLSFAIDRSQFSPPVDANEPPRQTATTVTFGERQFPATPFLIGDTRGFEAPDQDGAFSVFVMQSDGNAVLVDHSDGLRVSGTCMIREDEQ